MSPEVIAADRIAPAIDAPALVGTDTTNVERILCVISFPRFVCKLMGSLAIYPTAFSCQLRLHSDYSRQDRRPISWAPGPTLPSPHTASTEAIEGQAAGLPEEVESFRYRSQTDRHRRRVATVEDDSDRSRAEPAFSGGCSMLCCDPLPSSAGGQRSLISRPRFARHLCPEGLKSNDHLPVQGIGPHFRTIPHQLVGGVRTRLPPMPRQRRLILRSC